MDKLGDISVNAMLGTVVLIVGFAFLSIGVTQRNASTAEIAMHQSCGVSVATKSIKVPLVNNPTELDCRTEVGEVKLDAKNDAKAKQQALEQISKDALECWVQFGQGEVDFLQNMQGIFNGVVNSKTPRACFVCSEKTFSRDVKISWNDLVGYMRTHGPKNQNWNYSQALNWVTPAEYADAIKKEIDKAEDLNPILELALKQQGITSYKDALTEQYQTALKAVSQDEFSKGVTLGRSKAVYVVYTGQKKISGTFLGSTLGRLAGNFPDHSYFITVGTGQDFQKGLQVVGRSDLKDSGSCDEWKPLSPFFQVKQK